MDTGAGIIVCGIDRHSTKIAEDRRVVLCHRARSVLERQLRLRERLQRTGYIQHDSLFFDASGVPIKSATRASRGV